MSTLNFGPFSTLFASSGLLYIQTNCNVANRNFVTIQPASATPNFFQPLFGISVPTVYASSIYTGSTMFVSSPQSSFTLDTMAFISSGIYSTNMQQLVVSQGGLSSFRVFTGYKNWDHAYIQGSSNTINSVTNYSPLAVFSPSGVSYDGWRLKLANPSNAVIATFSTLSATGYTYALEWDGRKILAGGWDNTTPNNNIQLYLAPSSWSNTGVFNRPSFFRYTPGCVYPDNNPFTFCRDICYNGNQYVAVGDASNTNGTIKYSFDGITWRDSSNGGFVSGSAAGATSYFATGGYIVKWDGYKWVAGGSNSSGIGAIKYSYDAMNWSNSIYPGSASGGRLDRLVYYNNNIWVGTGIFTDCNIKYSYNGINWSNANYTLTGNWAIAAGSATANCSNNTLVATQNAVYISFGILGSREPANALTNFNLIRSFDGVNFNDSNRAYGFYPAIFDHIYNGTYIIGNNTLSCNINTTTPANAALANINANPPYINLQGEIGIIGAPLCNAVQHAKIMAPAGDYYGGQSYGVILYRYYGQRCKGLARSNVVPLLSMSNLKIYGSNYNDMSLSTNTIIGHKNLSDRGSGINITQADQTNHLEHQNFMAFNNTLRIWTHTSTQVIVNTPNNPNTRYSRLSLGRATLDVLCTINVRQATEFTRVKQVPAPFFPSSLGRSDQSFDFHVTGSTFMTNVGVGRGATSNDFFSTPTSFFDIYNNNQTSYVTFRGTVSNDTTVKNLLGATNNSYNVTCYPMVTGANSQLVYYWRNNNTNYRAVDATGTTYFTGQHPTNCLDISESNVSQYVGQLVSITNDGYTMYDLSGNQIKGKDAIQITNASPITKLTSTDKDSSVFGVVADCFNHGLQSDGTIDRYSESQFTTDLFGRIMVNCIGEGAIWVTNYGGNVSNGDYLCSCPIPGLSRKQDDGRLMNYTVAKATMSCDFNPPFVSTISTFVFDCSTFSTTVSCLAYKCEEIEFNGSSFFKAFIGCTYHCN